MKLLLYTISSIPIFLLGSVAAALENRAKRDVYVPPVLYPRAGTVWSVNQRHNVTWDVSNPPVNITNKFGQIRLRRNDLTTPLILANNFSILLGRIEIKVPFVVQGDYQIVLFGDSGNFSPTFTIQSPVKF